MNQYKIRKFIHKFGWDVTKYPTALLRNRVKQWNDFDIQIILDVGANVGQYGKELRSIGYKHKIISFEPSKDAFKTLKDTSAKDHNWEVHNLALGDFDGTEKLNIAQNSSSCSIRKINEIHVSSIPNTKTIGSEEIEVRKLDGLYHDLIEGEKNVFLKIDAQGFEKNILLGAKNCLQKISGLQLEMSIVELYEGEALFREMLDFCYEHGYTLYSLEPNFWDYKTGRLYQFDGIFYRA